MHSDIRYLPDRRFPRVDPASRVSATAGNVADAMLIARIAAGNRAAMRILYTRHHSRVRRFILRFVTDEAVADELVHEVFLDVWRWAGRFAGQSPVSTWLLAIARRDTLRSARARSRLRNARRIAVPPVT